MQSALREEGEQSVLHRDMGGQLTSVLISQILQQWRLDHPAIDSMMIKTMLINPQSWL